jgi:hypothetical protein
MRERLDQKRVGAAKLDARRKRISAIRVRVTTFAALIFVVLWLGVFAQLVLGHDPALAPKARALRRAALARTRLEARRTQRAVIDLSKLRPRPAPQPAAPAPSAAPATSAAPQPAPPPSPPPQPAPAPQPAAPAPAPTPVVTSQS